MLALTRFTIGLGFVSLILGIVFLSGKKGPKALEVILNKLIVKVPPVSEKYYKILGTFLILMASALFFIVFAFELV